MGRKVVKNYNAKEQAKVEGKLSKIFVSRKIHHTTNSYDKFIILIPLVVALIVVTSFRWRKIQRRQSGIGNSETFYVSDEFLKFLT